VVNAHGNVISWTITGDGKTETKPGQDYGSENKGIKTAQRVKVNPNDDGEQTGPLDDRH